MSSQIKSYISAITLSALVFLISCGPRTGIHEDNSEILEQDKKSEWICGNAIMEENNYGWAERELNITGDGQRGAKLFKQNCAICHSISDQMFTAPGLKGVYNRLPEPKATWLRNYIVNSDKVYASGDKYARRLHKKYPHERMTVFEGSLEQKDVDDIMIYVVGSTRE